MVKYQTYASGHCKYYVIYTDISLYYTVFYCMYNKSIVIMCSAETLLLNSNLVSIAYDTQNYVTPFHSSN